MSVKDEKSDAHKPTYLQFCFFYQALVSSLLWKQYLPALCVALVMSGLLQNLNDHLRWMVLRLSIPYLSFLKMMMIPSLRTRNQRMNQRLRIRHSEQHCLEILKASWRVLKCGSSRLTTATANTMFGCVILRKFCQVSNLLIFTIFLETVKVYAKRCKRWAQKVIMKLYDVDFASRTSIRYLKPQDFKEKTSIHGGLNGPGSISEISSSWLHCS